MSAWTAQKDTGWDLRPTLLKHKRKGWELKVETQTIDSCSDRLMEQRIEKHPLEKCVVYYLIYLPLCGCPFLGVFGILVCLLYEKKGTANGHDTLNYVMWVNHHQHSQSVNKQRCYHGGAMCGIAFIDSWHLNYYDYYYYANTLQ